MDCNARRLRLCPEQTPEAALEECETILDTWESYRQACREAQQARNHQEDLAAAVDAVDAADAVSKFLRYKPLPDWKGLIC